MMLKAVLFDLDGTLLPMDQDVFVKDYFGRLAKALAPYGYEPKKLIDSIWQGTAAMMKNDGSLLNEAVFWNTFCAIYGEGARAHIPVFEEFYQTQFPLVKASCGFLPDASKTVSVLKEKGLRVALATNPVFPAIATTQRIAWAGLAPSDFELVTTYENSYHAKPNPKYYLEVAERLGAAPEECLMVGNDVSEDLVAEALGMKVFLLTGCVINKKGADISAYPQGNLDDLLAYVDAVRSRV